MHWCCHYYQQKSLGNGNELLSSEEGKEESDTVSDNEENSEDDLAIADLYEQPIVQMPFLTFVPHEQIAEVTVEARSEWKKKTNKQTKIIALNENGKRKRKGGRC